MPRPKRPKLPEPVLVSAKANGVLFGVGQLKFYSKFDEKAYNNMDGMGVYIIEAKEYEEAWLKILYYIETLEVAPVWEDSSEEAQ